MTIKDKGKGYQHCERARLISQLKEVACHLKQNRQDMRPSFFIPIDKLKEKRNDSLREQAKKKYVSEWVPSYTKFDPKKHPLNPLPMPPPHVQILAGDLVSLCLCLRRNGLQDDCPKLGCKGGLKCTTRPIPTCLPSGLGELPPEPIMISRPKIVPCPETLRQNRLKRQIEKKERCQKFIREGQKNYTKYYCKELFFKPCFRHDGTYVRKVLLDERETQTNIEDLHMCKEPLIKHSSECVEGLIEDLKIEDGKKSSDPNQVEVEIAFKEKMTECKEALDKKLVMEPVRPTNKSFQDNELSLGETSACSSDNGIENTLVVL